MLVATGHEGDGICLSVITGDLIADLATGRQPRADITALTPDRFPPLNQAKVRESREPLRPSSPRTRGSRGHNTDIALVTLDPRVRGDDG
ncbi:MAG: hypothetical protein WDO24_08320 [Pseudomonadota bacterium]